jgi:hypothetical protein
MPMSESKPGNSYWVSIPGKAPLMKEKPSDEAKRKLVVISMATPKQRLINLFL